MAGDLLLDRGCPRSPSTTQSSPSSSMRSALSCPGAVGSPTYPNVNSFPRRDARMRVTVPSAPIPRMTCLLPTDPAASRMLVRSLRLLTAYAPLAMSQSMPLSVETILSAVGVPS